jgi:glycerol uptake facilitator-like aquaporin
MFDLPLLQVAEKVRFGPGQWLSEVVATFGLILTIFATLRTNAASVPQAVALYIVAAYWFTASTSFANPAVTIARALSNTFAGIRPLDAPAFVAVQFLGCILAVLLTRWLFASTRAS